MDFLDLRQADRGCDVGHPVVVAENRVPIAAVRIHAMIFKESDFVGDRIVVRHDHAAFARRYDFVPEETERRHIAQRSTSFWPVLWASLPRGARHPENI